MHQTVQNLLNIKSQIKAKINELKYNNYYPKIIAVSKTFSINHIMPLIESGHTHFGENKVQEALEKWSEIKNDKIKLHLVGKLQTNKVKFALKIFDYIHSLDNLKLAKKISEEQKKYSIKPKIFIQINIGNEIQKSGVNKDNLNDFYEQCQNLDLNIVGTMCLPPVNLDSRVFFSEMKKINSNLNLNELSMGMSSDYIDAIEFNSTFLRIGSNIFGKRN
ncbi:YggS family pyridoxal phosphate-dependent enzyme [Candidatus Pelagibacter sp.]|nr:YggS family pyridoxal phosphate-dependent enzyme [Candidatus Pelagibacter sp.]